MRDHPLLRADRDVTPMSERLNFPVTSRDREFAEAMRINRRATELVMLPQDYRDDRLPDRCVTQIKWDGIHALYRPDNAHSVTREGVDMLCADHLRPGLSAIAATLRAMFGSEHVIVGEYVNVDGFEATLGDFKRGRGTGCLQAFDAVPVAAYEGREASPPLLHRLQRLQRAAHRVGRDAAGGVGLCKSAIWEGPAREAILPMMPQLWAQGLEGIVVKDADSPYVRAASPYWQRIKQRQTIDLPVVSIDAPGGRLKALVVRHGATDVRVGVGFSERQRAAPADFRVGMIVELRHLGQTAGGSLRSPAFLRVRTDKES